MGSRQDLCGHPKPADEKVARQARQGRGAERATPYVPQNRNAAQFRVAVFSGGGPDGSRVLTWFAYDSYVEG